jgi:hypothetical protein
LSYIIPIFLWEGLLFFLAWLTEGTFLGVASTQITRTWISAQDHFTWDQVSSVGQQMLLA